MLVRTVAVPRRAASRSSWSASRSSTTAASRPSGRWSTTTATPPTRPAPARRSGCRPTWRSASRATACAPGTCCARASSSTARCRGRRASPSPADVDEANARLGATTRFWRAWLGRARLPDHRWREPIQRSALAIKGLTYMPTGATVAALTTSLPETPGGERNWDYRFTWMRDSTFTLQALHFLNLDWEADEFMQFVADLEPNDDGGAADHVRDRRPARPDRVDARRPLRLRGRAPGADRQRRLRPAPERRLRRGARLDPAAHAAQPAAAAAAVADRPGAGRVRHARLARARPGHLGGARQAAALRVLEADVLGRAGPRGEAGRDPRRRRAAARPGARPPTRSRPTSSSTASTSAACCASTTTTDALDASTLLAAIFGFLPGDDERLRASVLAIADELTEDGFVLRYRTDETDDGLSGKEGTFLICSFWLVSALAIIGEHAARPRPDGAPAARRLAARALRRGVRRRHRPAPRQLPAGLLAPRADRGGRADHRRRARRGVCGHERLRRDRDRQRRRRRHARAPPGPVGQAHPAARARRLAARASRRTGSPHDVFVDNRYVSPDTWYDERGKPFQPQVHYFVGGATKLYGAALYRLRTEDFGELRHHDGISPAWPISYDEMEPYYTRGRAALPGARRARRGPDRAAGERALPVPGRVSHEPRIQQLSDDLAAAGHHPFHAPCGVMLDEDDMPHSACVRCATCDGFPCLVHAKSDAEVLGVRPALEHPNVTLLTNAEAVRLETNDAGHDRHRGRRRARRRARDATAADIVVVSCGAANSAKLLLASATDTHPHGLANGSDQVGRNYMFHNSQAVLALSKEPNPTGLPEDARRSTTSTSAPTTSSTRWATSRWSASRRPRCTAARSRSRRSSRPSGRSSKVARHAVDFWLSTEDLPLPENRVTPARRRQHHAHLHGRPTTSPRSACCTSSSRCSGTSACTTTTCFPRHAYLKNDIPVAGVAHQAGTCRFGTDPATSVLNADCRAHELDNLYVVDTSFFPSIGAVNPALTAMANALRVGDHLLERLGAPPARRSRPMPRDDADGAAPRRHRRRRLRRRRLRAAAGRATTTCASR